MTKFLLTYWIGIALLFGIFYWDLSPISEGINNLQTNFSAYLTSLTLTEGIMDNHRIVISSHYALVIEKACNGMIPYLFFFSFNYCFPFYLKAQNKMGYLRIYYYINNEYYSYMDGNKACLRRA